MGRSRQGDSHLGDLLSAFVDGELGHNCRDRVLAHLATCEPCRQQADAERQIKAQLARTALPPPPTALSERLRALAEAGGPAPHRAAGPAATPAPRARPGLSAGRGRLDSARRPAASLPSTPTRQVVPARREVPRPIRPLAATSGSGLGAEQGRDLPSRGARRRTIPPYARPARRGGRVALLAASAVTVGGTALGGTIALGAPAPEPLRPAQPPLDALTAQQAASGARLPLADPATGAVQLAAVGGAFLLRPGALSPTVPLRRATGLGTPPLLAPAGAVQPAGFVPVVGRGPTPGSLIGWTGTGR